MKFGGWNKELINVNSQKDYEKISQECIDKYRDEISLLKTQINELKEEKYSIECGIKILFEEREREIIKKEKSLKDQEVEIGKLKTNLDFLSEQFLDMKKKSDKQFSDDNIDLDNKKANVSYKEKILNEFQYFLDYREIDLDKKSKDLDDRFVKLKLIEDEQTKMKNDLDEQIEINIENEKKTEERKRSLELSEEENLSTMNLLVKKHQENIFLIDEYTVLEKEVGRKIVLLEKEKEDVSAVLEETKKVSIQNKVLFEENIEKEFFLNNWEKALKLKELALEKKREIYKITSMEK